uniref:Glycosyltransferase n=1 Tax=Chenopodium quinoa TaxID=63459 RepID=A0A803MIG8_CHEQI
MANISGPIALNIAFYPWFALGHLTSFLRLANKLAERGHKVSYYLPTKTQSKLALQNHNPDQLTLIPIDVPPVDGLPPGAETTNDATSAAPLIMTAMDMTRDTIESHLAQLKPDFVFYDFAYWMPELGRKHGFKTVHYITGYIARYALFATFINNQFSTKEAADKAETLPELPSEIFWMRAHESKIMAGVSSKKFGLKGLTLGEQFGKRVLLAGPVVPKPPSSKLEERFDDWLNVFGAASVIYCALGSECVLEINQFQELLLGLELTGKPFLAALKPPKDSETVESAFPIGFEDRIRGRGIIHGGWVQQQLILQHPSVGCFVTHCGIGSLSEAMGSQCQVVLMPQAVDQFIYARQMSLELKIGVEVEPREDDGLFTKEAVYKAVSMVMDEGSEVAAEVKANHAKWREFILKDDLEDSYISSFIQSLQQMLE